MFGLEGGPDRGLRAAGVVPDRAVDRGAVRGRLAPRLPRRVRHVHLEERDVREGLGADPVPGAGSAAAGDAGGGALLRGTQSAAADPEKVGYKLFYACSAIPDILKKAG